jgi:hypothetical protein
MFLTIGEGGRNKKAHRRASSKQMITNRTKCLHEKTRRAQLIKRERRGRFRLSLLMRSKVLWYVDVAADESQSIHSRIIRKKLLEGFKTKTFFSSSSSAVESMRCDDQCVGDRPLLVFSPLYRAERRVCYDDANLSRKKLSTEAISVGAKSNLLAF